MLAPRVFTWCAIVLFLRGPVSVTGTPEDDFKRKCAVDPASYFIVPGTGCKAFYQCQALVGGGFELRRQDCPAGLVFDLNVKVCNFPGAVTCGVTPEDDIYMTPGTPEDDFKRKCAKDPASYFIVPGTGCKAFYQCQALVGGGFELRRQDCPAGLVFDLNVKVCNYPGAVTCKGQSTSPADCKAVDRKTGQQVYTIYPDGETAMEVECDFSDPGRPWIVIQRQASFSEFNRTWQAYEQGFGPRASNFWLGLANLHILTSDSPYRLRVEMTDQIAGDKYAEYAHFSVGNAETGYKLSVDGYSGNAGDMLQYHDGSKFTTIDHDNDRNPDDNCARQYGGGFWFNACFVANPNGRYGSHSLSTGVIWRATSTFFRSLDRIEMKIRK